MTTVIPKHQISKAIYFTLLLVLINPSYADTSHTIVWESGVYIKTLEKWASALNKASSPGSTTYIQKKVGGADKLHKTGHRDTITWIPHTTDLSQPFIMVIWFHGHYGFVRDRTFINRTLKQLDPMTTVEQNKNFVLVLPEMPWSVHTRTPTKRNSQLWKKRGDFLEFVEQAEDTLREHLRKTNRYLEMGSIEYRVVGHSAGGSTIKRLGMTGDLCQLSPTMVVWSDSSYGSWLDLAWDGCLKKSPHILTKVFVAKGDSPWRNALRFMKRFNKAPKNLQVHVMKKPKWSHKLIGNNVVALSNLLGERK